jgi:transposase InsO family protein
MRLRGLRAKKTKRFKTTTKRDKAARAAPNLLERDFTTDRPNQKWVTDITYIRTAEGWLYLAAVLDLFSRRIVGWVMSDRMISDLKVSALKMAVQQRQVDPGLLHHSDQGGQYTAEEYKQLIVPYGGCLWGTTPYVTIQSNAIVARSTRFQALFKPAVGHDRGTRHMA